MHLSVGVLFVTVFFSGRRHGVAHSDQGRTGVHVEIYLVDEEEVSQSKCIVISLISFSWVG